MAFKKSVFVTKLTNWEYWPTYISNIPVVFFWLYFAIRSRHWFFFSAANPVIETGGVLGESKINILRRLPQSTIPRTIHIRRQDLNQNFIEEQIEINNLQYPVIFKPDIGERGFLISIINNRNDIKTYVDKYHVDLLIQEYIDYPLELSVLYHRFPEKYSGNLTSICIKKTLSVVGDGHSKIKQLMRAYPRANLQLERFEKDHPELLEIVLNIGEEYILEPIGNHSRGTTFLNGNHLIDDQLTAAFDRIALEMKDIYYGRFDLKCTSIEDLKNGLNFKILEFNGVAGEPAHMFDPSYPVWKAYRDLFLHWRIIYQISTVQRKRGVDPMSLQEGISSIRQYLKYKREAIKNN